MNRYEQHIAYSPRALLTLATLMTAASFSSHAQAAPWPPSAYHDEVTGAKVHRLVTGPSVDSVIYYTHPMWTQGMAHLCFDSARDGKATAPYALRMADGVIRQLAPEGCGASTLARRTNRFYYEHARAIYARVVDDVFADQAAPALLATLSEHILTPAGGISLDANEETLYLGALLEKDKRWALLALNLADNSWRMVTELRFPIGHVQASPFDPGLVMFCHETGGFATQRTWVIHDGDIAPGPFFKAPHDYWVTHESWWAPGRIIFTVWPYDEQRRNLPHGILSVGMDSRNAVEHARYPAWHTHGSPDGKWIVGDDFDRNLWLINTATGERRLLTQGHLGAGRNTHPHPSFTPDSKGVLFNSSRDGAPDIFLVEIPPFETLPPP